MKIIEEKIYKCSSCSGELELSVIKKQNDTIITGEFKSEEGIQFPIRNGIPDFTWPKELSEIDRKSRELYDKLAEEYDKFASIPFQTFHADEHEILALKYTEIFYLLARVNCN